MKILILSDIHGSLNALNAIVNTDDYKTADKTIFLGDVVFGASRPNECIELLTKLNIDCVVGNNDAYIYDHIPEADKCTFSQGKLKQLKWMSDNINQKNKDIMSKWPKSTTITMDNNQFYFTHYVWEFFNNDYNVVDTDSVPTLENREKMFCDINKDEDPNLNIYYIYGHEHRRHYFTNGNKHYLCLTTSGLSTPASYTIITVENGGVDIKEKFVEFNLKEEIELMDKAGYPYAKHKIG